MKYIFLLILLTFLIIETIKSDDEFNFKYNQKNPNPYFLLKLPSYSRFESINKTFEELTKKYKNNQKKINQLKKAYEEIKEIRGINYNGYLDGFWYPYLRYAEVGAIMSIILVCFYLKVLFLNKLCSYYDKVLLYLIMYLLILQTFETFFGHLFSEDLYLYITVFAISLGIAYTHKIMKLKKQQKNKNWWGRKNQVMLS